MRIRDGLVVASVAATLLGAYSALATAAPSSTTEQDHATQFCVTRTPTNQSLYRVIRLCVFDVNNSAQSGTQQVNKRALNAAYSVQDSSGAVTQFSLEHLNPAEFTLGAGSTSASFRSTDGPCVVDVTAKNARPVANLTHVFAPYFFPTLQKLELGFNLERESGSYDFGGTICGFSLGAPGNGYAQILEDSRDRATAATQPSPTPSPTPTRPPT